MSREDWWKVWGYVAGSAEAEAAWLDKQMLDGRKRSARVISDHIDPVLSHADGRMYDSKSALHRTYRADGNPQGVRYECIGEKVAKPYERPKRDKAAAHEAVTRALAKLGM